MPVKRWFAKAIGSRRSERSDAGPLTPLARAIALTWAGMVLERALRAFWPLLSVLAVLLAALAFNFPAELGAQSRWFWWAAAVVLLAGLGWGLWKMRWPRRAEAIARLDATLPGRPLAALTDEMALGGDDPGARALWAAHLRRMAEQAQSARPPRPNPDLARRDPYALRMTALSALVVAVIFGVPARIWNPSQLNPGASGSAQAAMGPSWEGWASPPRYTGKPGLYLNKVEGDTITVPEGTRFSIRLYGSAGAIKFSESVSNPAALPQQGAAQSGEGVETREFEAERNGLITLDGPAGRVFHVAVASDSAPKVTLEAAAQRRADGKLSQPFHAEDDYAVTEGHAVISLDLAKVDRRYGLAIDPEKRPDLIYDLPMPITGSRADFTENLIEDAAKHPWANLPVKIKLEVVDGRGQTGTTGVREMILPGKRFFDPLAAALIEVRRDLLWSRANAPREAELLRAISNRHQGFIKREEVYLMVRLVIGRLEDGDLTPEARDEIAEALWKMAELVEDGGLSDALAAMQKAQEKLSEAIRNGASKDEIAKLMQELKEATDNYVRMLAERAQEQDEGPQFGQQNQPSQQITGDQIQQMMDQIQKLMEEGRMAEAQELLDQLSRMMENLKVTQGQGGQGDTPGGQAMRDLQDTLRKQQDLSDQSFRDLQDQFMTPEERQRQQPGGRQNAPGAQQPGQQGQSGEGAQGQDQAQQGQGQGQGEEGQGQDGQGQGETGQGQDGQANRDGQGQGDQPGLEGGQGGTQGQSLAERQRALRRELDRQKGLIPGFDSEKGKQAERRLDDAGRAMDQAEQALRQGDNGAAIDRQADAIQALRDGMRALGEVLRGEQARQQGQPGESGDQQAGGQGQPGGREMPRDPLGRAQGEGSQAGTNQDMLQGEDVYRRAQNLLDEIRRRSADRLRPEEELDYLKRLLDQFGNAG
ncbi:ATPase [Thioclava dalianensis]|uniref:ATPase n=1 Tax=Thioclava dalianensis TaxID=1185766 RepID=A0A074TM77_9RHOB|nr:DUF4175 domain-containing protein [Thioclava dalianensis]KEP71250.1 ATPase [Thioclava dalianensis]SFM75421.1 TIGR02302 family protein [Thioclava dalianensis]